MWVHSCLSNCNVHFADPGRVRLLESGKAVAQKEGHRIWLEAVRLATRWSLRGVFLLKHITAVDRVREYTCLEAYKQKQWILPL